jgi:hypothetical protein
MLKELGAANLRDGVTLVPASGAAKERLGEIVRAIESEQGSAWLFEIAASPLKNPIASANEITRLHCRACSSP